MEFSLVVVAGVNPVAPLGSTFGRTFRGADPIR